LSLLDIKGVADKLRVSVRTVERLKKDGKLPPHRLVLGCHRWPEDEIEAYIRALPRFDAVEVRS
jgi:excisionase family DNA binding protein